MIHIILPNNKIRPLVFYLAMEEYLAKNCNDECFFLWQVAPTVICGRNQDIEAEVNLQYCKEKSIAVFRRKSGGGCVYSDSGNIMLSYITPNTEVDTTFSYFLDRMVEILKKLNFSAVKSTNNDILIDGKKVSGNAFFKTERASIVHGTLLYDVDFCDLQTAITPSVAKLQSHGIKSVRQRVVNLKSLCQEELTIEKLKEFIITSFCNREKVLSDDDIIAIEKIEEEYLNPKFIYGQ